ncbi:MAG: hypothetical protein CMJ64_23470 [Planctomycetaceae bacterium]|nr:hypothetical protein [Planctomycetaceae bacterium]
MNLKLLTPVTALLLLACNTAAADDSNLGPNPSFEQAEAEGFVADDWKTREGIQVERITDGGRTGEACVRFSDDSTDKGQMLECRRIPARPGGNYTASAWLRTSDSCRPGVYLNFYDLNGRRIEHRYERTKGSPADWQKVVVQQTAPESAWEVAVAIYSYVSDVGVFEADDAELTVTGGDEPGAPGLTRAEAGDKPPYDIGQRRELFVDDFLIDGMSGGIERRLHHPDPREVVLKLDQPWEGQTSAYFATVRDGERVLMYYRGQVAPGSDGQVCCLAESRDGIHFKRVNAGLFEYEGSKENNIVWKGVGAHNFTPFLDSNPDAVAAERFKAVGYSHHGRGLGIFTSPDGIHWRELLDHPAITNGAFDSQNLAFWDPLRECYVDFHRKGRNGVRDIMTCTSKDFRTWSEPVFLEYSDTRLEHLYTNGIQRYGRAPHLYIGFPARFVPGRIKVEGREPPGVSDAILISSRDGLHFQRWSNAFIRPSTEPEVWTDRNNYPAWGLIETGPEELSIYWTEHYRHPGMRLRRGAIRKDGFVSLQSAGKVGEALTRPLLITGDSMEVNYATDATGWIRFELCKADGTPIECFTLYDSETLFGNQLQHTVVWRGGSLSGLNEQSIRLRIRMENADLYSLRFVK